MTNKSSGPPKKVAKPPSPHNTVGEWAGIPNYRCAYCSFATVDGEEVMRQHLVDRHMNMSALRRSVSSSKGDRTWPRGRF